MSARRGVGTAEGGWRRRIASHQGQIETFQILLVGGDFIDVASGLRKRRRSIVTRFLDDNVWLLAPAEYGAQGFGSP